ncbi:MAG: hypothetical protein J5720_07145 [Bacteroidaceae bacterium]|nr:hypothetical protein [Bacteroidaceae bacterium]
MKRTRTLSFMVVLLLCIPVFAQWTKPKAPASTPLAKGTKLYLYNPGADGFFMGANEWGTRASFSSTVGHKVILEASTEDANSYLITNAADDADTFLPLYIKDVNGVWVDESGENTGDDLFTFIAQDDGTYKIGLSALNKEFNPTNFKDTYLGVIPEMNDTRLYLTDPETYVDGVDFNASGFHITWYFVTPENYLTYTASMKQYLAAMTLGDMIAIAEQTEGVNAEIFASVKGVYANTSATVDELAEATKTLKAAIDQANFDAASVEKPFEMLSTNDDVEQTFTSGETTGWTSTIAAQNKQANNGNAAVDYNVTGNHYENWNGSPFGTGRIYATLTKIPNGVYRFSALAFASETGGTYLYAGNQKTLVESTKIDIEQETSVLVIVTDNTLEFGLRVEEKGPNWVGLDNVNLYYMGESYGAYEYAGTTALKEAPDYETYLAENEGMVFYQKATYTAYCEAKLKLLSDMDLDGGELTEYGKMISEDITQFKEATAALQASLDAYTNYYNVYLDADDWITTMSTDSEAANKLGDYLMSEDEPAEGSFNGNGGSQYLLTEGLLDVAGIQAEQEYLAKLLNDAVASGMSDGDDCTELLKNPNFKEEGGWKSAVGPVWPVGSEDFRVFQAQNMVCDVYQELTGLQNGLYEMNLQAVFRPGETYTEENAEVAKAYAYINSYESKVTSADVNSADAASAAFVEGQYPLTVYGLVTDGTMRVGITNKVRSVEGCMLWAGGVKLTFRAKNAEVLSAVIAQTTPNAEALLSTLCGQAELDTLQAAINEAQAPADAYNALVTLKAAMEDIAEGADLYERLAVAIKSLDEAIKGSTTANAATIANAQGVLDAAKAAYDSKAYDNNQAEQAVNEVNAAAVSVKMGGETASEDNPVDYTSAIVNNNFDPDKGNKNEGKIEGWVTTAMNGYKEYTVSYNRAAFELNQKLSGLPKGKYKVTVHTYYRAGYWNEEEALMKEGKETHLTTLYAETSEKKFTKPVMTLTEGATTEQLSPSNKFYTLSNGLYAPDGTTGTAEYFKAGAYLNELEFTVPADGEVTIGLSKTEVIANDYEVVGEWKLWYMGDPEKQLKATDVSTLIVNNNFDPDKGNKNEGKIEGWVTTAMNGYKEYTVSYNRAAFELNQTLNGLPEGTYKVTVHTYYRAGYWNEEEALMAQNQETHLTTLYAETATKKYSKPVMNLTEGATTEQLSPSNKFYTLSNGLYAPDGTTGTAEYFKAGAYLNELPFYVGNDGTVKIGLSKTEVIANDYEVVGEWKLYYYGAGDKVAEIGGDTAIKAIELNAGNNVAGIFNTSGARLAAPQRGINIIRTAEGKTIKVLVK